MKPLFLSLAGAFLVMTANSASAACISQDRQFSYEGYDRASALSACRRVSEEPARCYVKRCDQGPAPARPRRLTKDEIRNINDAILQQRCIAGGICRP